MQTELIELAEVNEFLLNNDFAVYNLEHRMPFALLNIGHWYYLCLLQAGHAADHRQPGEQRLQNAAHLAGQHDVVDTAAQAADGDAELCVAGVDHVHVDDNLVSADVLRVDFEAADVTKQVAAVDLNAWRLLFSM